MTTPDIASKVQEYNKSVAQTILRSDVQNRIIILNSIHKKRILQNSQIFGFVFSAKSTNDGALKPQPVSRRYRIFTFIQKLTNKKY